MRKSALSVFSASLLAWPSTLHAATVWAEAGDAGDSLATRQQTAGVGVLTQISGTLPTDSDVDIYQITIPTPALFTAWVDGFVTSDPDLWLFDSSGFGVVHNDIVSGGKTSLTGAFVLAAGNYFLAISNDGAEALSSGGPIWAPAYNFTGARAPDGTGAAQPFINWSGPMINNGLSYTIHLDGAEFSTVPEASSTLILAVSCLFVSQRRVRKSLEK